MKTKILVSGAVILASTMSLALADPKEELTAAIKKLAEADNYAWTTKTQMGGSDRVGESSGKATKDGLIHYSMTMRENTVEMVKKGDKAAMKGEDGWRTLEEIEGAAEEGDDQGRRRGRWRTGWVRNIELPTAEAMEILEQIEELEMEDGAYTAALSEEAVREMSRFGGRRRGGDDAGGERQGPEIKDASGKVTFWVKDGVLSKMTTTTKSTMNWNGEDRTFERTSTVEISGVGETKVEVPEEVKAKLES